MEGCLKPILHHELHQLRGQSHGSSLRLWERMTRYFPYRYSRRAGVLWNVRVSLVTELNCRIEYWASANFG